jgi:hypothetical protein
MKNKIEKFDAMFKGWADDRGSTEADRPALRAIAFEFFAFGNDTAVLGFHTQAQAAAWEIPKALLDPRNRFQYNVEAAGGEKKKP